VTTFFESGETGALILGSIGELGDQSPLLHRTLGESLAPLCHEETTVFTVGGLAREIGKGLVAAGLSSSHWQHFDVDQLDQLIAALSLCDPASLLVKGSRSVRLERLIPLLDAHASTSHSQE